MIRNVEKPKTSLSSQPLRIKQLTSFWRINPSVVWFKMDPCVKFRLILFDLPRFASWWFLNRGKSRLWWFCCVL